MKPQTLSDKIKRFPEWGYPEEDVREFIRLLKEEILEWDDQAHHIIDIIYDLAGEKLTK